MNSTVNQLHNSLTVLCQALDLYLEQPEAGPIKKEEHPIWLAVFTVERLYEDFVGIPTLPGSGRRIWQKLLMLSRWESYEPKKWPALCRKFGFEAEQKHDREAIFQQARELRDWAERKICELKQKSRA